MAGRKVPMKRHLRISSYMWACYLVSFVVMGVAVVFLVNTQLREQALIKADSEARLLLDRNLATHKYFSQELRPKVFRWSEPFRTPDYFDPSWMSSTYVVRQMDKIVHELNREPYYYKESAINARSPENEADEYERQFLEDLNRDPHLTKKSAIRYFDGKPYLTVLRKGESMEPSCLRCHGTPDAAPKGLVDVYGPEKSFHRQDDEVVQVISMRIPLDAAYEVANRLSLELSGLFLALLLGGFAGLFVFTRRHVLVPIETIRAKAALIAGSEEHLGETIPEPKGLELRELARAFNSLSINMKRDRDELEKRVKERTSELTEAYEALLLEIEGRKRFEEGMLKSEKKYRTLFEESSDGIYRVTKDGDITDANQSFLDLFGLTRNEIFGESIRDRYAEPALRLEFQATIEKSGFVKDYPVRFKKKGGTEMDCLLTTTVVRNDEGEVVGYQGIVRDVTEHVRAQEALMREREQLLSIFDGINQIIYVMDLKTYRVLFANRYTVEFYGKDLIGRICYEELHGLESPCPFCSIAQVLELAGEPYQSEYHDADVGKDYMVIDRLIKWPDGADAKFQLAIDITEAKSLKSQLLQAQKMEVIGTLAGGVAHDFNNMLQVVLGYSDMLLIGRKPESPEYNELMKINIAARRGADLVKQLMTFSRKTPSEPRPLNINQKVKEVRTLLERTIPKMISVELRLHAGLPVINADPTQIEQVLMNLAVNARDAMPDGGTLTIETRNVALDRDWILAHGWGRTGLYVLLEVSDSGQGMEEEILDHIFEPFYTTKEVGKGTGLGLATVYGIVTQHGGHIDCASTPGHGSTFRIYFPAIDTEKSENHQVNDWSPPGGTETILVVDDEDFVLDLAEKFLRKSGYTVLTASNGIETLDLCRKESHKIDLVILDLMMPRMGGKQCIAELKKMDPEIKVLIASGFHSSTASAEAHAMGARGFVAKPYDVRELLKKVRHVLDGD